jgi:hypothetical protein
MDEIMPILQEELAWAWENTLEEGCLSGLCAISSVRTFTALRAKGVEGLRLAINDCHCFILWDAAPGGSTILDVTASQFGDEGLSQGLLIAPYPRTGEFWYASHTFRSVKSLLRFMDRSGWPPDQIPS